MQASNRKERFFGGVLLIALCLVLRAGAAEFTVTNGSPDDFQTELGEIATNGGGTILVTTPIVIGGTNPAGPYEFDGGSNVVVSGGNTNSIFVVADGGVLNAANLALENGVSTNGGAVYVFAGGVATFTNCLFSNNLALGVAGFSSSTSTNGSTNSTSGGGGTNSTSGSSTNKTTVAGGPAFGGAIYDLGSSVIFECQFVTNRAIGGAGENGADGNDGNIQGGNGKKGGNGAGALGGAVYTAGQLLIINSTFSANAAEAGSGGSGGAGGSGLTPGNPGAGGRGGDAAGGGIYSTNASAVIVISNSTFVNNIVLGGSSATGGVGAAGLGQGGPRGGNAFGGGLANDIGSQMTLTNCTFFENGANGGAGGNGGDGGGRGGNGGNGGSAIGGGIYNAGTVSVVNCTFSKGSAAGGTNGVAGSGISAGRNGSRGASRGGNIANVAKRKKGEVTFMLANSIVGTNLSGGGGYGLITDGNFNISIDRSIVFNKSAKKGGTNSLAKTNPLIGDLANNGGPTETIALPTNSPAVDFIPPADAPTFDQRGTNRPIQVFTNDWSDAGAFELDPNAITIIDQPQDVKNEPVGSNVSFSVLAQSLRQPLYYQWFYSPSNVTTADLLPGETNTSLNRTNVQLTNSGQYQVLITNAFDSALSRVATLTVTIMTNSPPAITQQPTNSQTVLIDTTVTISVTVTGTPPFAYQWFKQNFQGAITNLSDSGNYSGSTSNVLTIANAQTNNSAIYFVTVTNIAGSVTSSNSFLNVTNSTSASMNGESTKLLREVQLVPSAARQYETVPEEAGADGAIWTPPRDRNSATLAGRNRPDLPGFARTVRY
jgi:hypothetical protein